VWHDGGKTITVDTPLDTLPMFARSGAILPMGDTMQYVGEKPDDQRTVLMFPPPDDHTDTFSLIEDDGISFDYQNGGYTRIDFKITSDAEQITVDIDRAVNGYSVAYDSITCVFPQTETRKIVIRRGDETIHEAQGTTQVQVPLN